MFEFAAAIAGVTVGLLAVLCLSLLAVVAAWRLLGQAQAGAAPDTSGASTRADIDDLEASIERLDRTVGQMAVSLAALIELLEQELK